MFACGPLKHCNMRTAKEQCQAIVMHVQASKRGQHMMRNPVQSAHVVIVLLMSYGQRRARPES
jgi:hypothetical protein